MTYLKRLGVQQKKVDDITHIHALWILINLAFYGIGKLQPIICQGI